MLDPEASGLPWERKKFPGIPENSYAMSMSQQINIKTTPYTTIIW